MTYIHIYVCASYLSSLMIADLLRASNNSGLLASIKFCLASV